MRPLSEFALGMRSCFDFFADYNRLSRNSKILAHYTGQILKKIRVKLSYTFEVLGHSIVGLLEPSLVLGRVT